MPKRKRGLTPLENQSRTITRRQERRMVQHPQYAARIFPSTVARFSCGPMTRVCQHCRALRFDNESLNCCHNGKVSLPLLSPYPDELRHLLTQKSVESTNFLENIRRYNSAFAMASMGASIVQPPGRGPYCFRIHGQIYHRSGTLHPPPGKPRTYSQLYILEGQQAVQARLSHAENQDCRNDVMQTILNVLQRLNPFVAAYKQMHQIEQEEIERAATEQRSPSTVTMVIKKGKDPRRYNEPRHDEVAAIFVGQNGAPPPDRDIIIYPHGHGPTLLSSWSENCDPMVYPILFPSGDQGYRRDQQHTEQYKTQHRNTITLLQYYAYRLAIRHSFSAIHACGKLFQQYIVDAYVKTEGFRLHYIRTNQTKLRVDLYTGLMDHVRSKAEERHMQPGKIVVLPSSFPGSPRAMQHNYQDAMAIVAKYGKPDLFLTFTCNPKSQDITNNLGPNQRPEHRPDLVARVFKQQLTELLDDILHKHVLGKVAALVYVIEFQKRGLPHTHMLIILESNSKLQHPADIDSIISAEIPDPITNPVLYDIISSTMIHGPCGHLNPKSVCMDKGQCTKAYPKPYQPRTTLAANGYPNYRRADNGRTIKIRSLEVDNR